MIYKLKDNRVLRAYYGGKRLDNFFGKTVCKDTRYPEEWVASVTCAKNDGETNKLAGLSYCENGVSVKDLIASNPEKMLGTEKNRRFNGELSVLVKILDANERLFIQCHPTVEMAKKYFNSNFGKTECWFIIEAEKDACVYLGFKQGITREKWEQLFEKQDIDGMLECLNKVPVRKGDAVFVDGGMPHAIGGGCMLIEAQEPTDLMVIPERTSKSGITLSDEKMHGGLGFNKMFDCFIYKGYSEDELRRKYVKHFNGNTNGLSTVVGADWTDKFTVDYLNLMDEFYLKLDGSFRVVIVLDGCCSAVNGEQKMELRKSDMLFISADTPDIKLYGNAKLIICC